MATMSKVFDDSSSVSNPPPSYDSISTSAPADSIWYKRSVVSFLQPKQIPRATALSRIREIVSSPDFTPSSVGPIVDSWAAALPVAEFSALLQRCNIEDHTALYWAIVKKRREALWAFTKFISEFSPACSLDLRLACLATNDHDLFMRLNLGDNVNPKDKSLRRMLGCPRDEIQVFRHGLVENCYIVRLVFKMFQARLRITQEFAAEFIARGRIWVLRFYMRTDGKWYVGYHDALSQYRPPPGSDTNTTPELLLHLKNETDTLVPKGSYKRYTVIEPDGIMVGLSVPLDDWLNDDTTYYVDCDGTLTASLRMIITYVVLASGGIVIPVVTEASNCPMSMS